MHTTPLSQLRDHCSWEGKSEPEAVYKFMEIAFSEHNEAIIQMHACTHSIVAAFTRPVQAYTRPNPIMKGVAPRKGTIGNY